ncbi:CDP-diglyceride synthetase [Halogranum gelatinilyticum]|uniref:CDP-archaeol synthase n=1 Tax=Halogranum gelatinilyticum TaxID=660521 RepID=A0A1G9PMU7_9EURY|nr:CDP-2,3-bis-(O-geranylgeranyl)-sn-glycerol synthase [Halogranum gelatinilyticum]SDL99903.1 CDP-diglyceride synthetase [Halogranum gelatinilyticum]
MLRSLVLKAFWTMLPAYVPNNVAVLAGGGEPIDGGRTWNGRRLLGDGKTWRGTAVGTLAGVLLALVLDLLRGPLEKRLGVSLPAFSLKSAFALSFGAMLGDIGASFLKRRSGRERGAAFPGLDQLDFVAGSLGLTAALAPAWFRAAFKLPVLVVVVVMTPVLHVVTNVIAYVLGLKDEPW